MYYSVIKLQTVGDRSFLIIKKDDGMPQISVYCEHTGMTLMRPCQPTLENMKLAIAILEKGN